MDHYHSQSRYQKILTVVLFILFLIPLTHVIAGGGGGGGSSGGSSNNEGDNSGSTSDDNSGSQVYESLSGQMICTNGNYLNTQGQWVSYAGSGNEGTHGSNGTATEYSGTDTGVIDGTASNNGGGTNLGGTQTTITNWPLICLELGTKTCTRSFITQVPYQTNCRFENASTHSGSICDTRYRNVRSMAAVSCAALYPQCTNTTPSDSRPPLTCIDQNLCGPGGNLYHQNSACVTNPVSVQSCSYGCTGSRCKAAPGPTITAFTIKPTLVRPGTSVSLTWVAEHASSCTVTDSASGTTLTGLSGRETSEPIKSQTTFTLTCLPLEGAQNDDGTPASSISDTRTVSVKALI